MLFCPLTCEQREIYRSYINSEEVEAIMDGTRDVLGGIDIMKKICSRHAASSAERKLEGA